MPSVTVQLSLSRGPAKPAAQPGDGLILKQNRMDREAGTFRVLAGREAGTFRREAGTFRVLERAMGRTRSLSEEGGSRAQQS
jgi:hypothetical protein